MQAGEASADEQDAEAAEVVQTEAESVQFVVAEAGAEQVAESELPAFEASAADLLTQPELLAAAEELESAQDAARELAEAFELNAAQTQDEQAQPAIESIELEPQETKVEAGQSQLPNRLANRGPSLQRWLKPKRQSPSRQPRKQVAPNGWGSRRFSKMTTATKRTRPYRTRTIRWQSMTMCQPMIELWRMTMASSPKENRNEQRDIEPDARVRSCFA
ncbi:hypothetical protein J4711_13425 [Staphylococcus epidermidis]|nr:hypothetical protein [Staphylococcus epidermidis]